MLEGLVIKLIQNAFCEFDSVLVLPLHRAKLTLLVHILLHYYIFFLKFRAPLHIGSYKTGHSLILGSFLGTLVVTKYVLLYQPIREISHIKN